MVGKRLGAIQEQKSGAETVERKQECSRQVGAGLAPALIDSAENGKMVEERQSGTVDG